MLEHSVRKRPEPAQKCGFLSVSPGFRHGSFDQVCRSFEIAASLRVMDCISR